MAKLVDFYPRGEQTYPRYGLLLDDVVVEIGQSAKGTLVGWLRKGQKNWDAVQAIAPVANEAAGIVLSDQKWRVLKREDVVLCSPMNNPTSLRDFYAFEQHVKTANENRGREVPAEWYQIPVFYFSNHTAIYGHDDEIPCPSYTQALDYELQVACVIGKAGRDIPAERAEEHIFGYMIYNDWSARDVQRQEMAVGLGPAKGKDFAQSFGPYLVTPDELADRHTGRPGVYDLTMIARVNGEERSRGNWKDLHWSFGDMIARASQDVTLYPGDVIGSGTVGTGCLLETTGGKSPWLQPGNVVELEIERLGVLRNIVKKQRKDEPRRHEEHEE